MFTRKSHLIAWTIICITIGLTLILYLSLSLSIHKILMPLDDTYIHFQYARQMASGEPYVYNTGDDPTSGATSFLYTPLLALGYLIGFKGLSLGYWALGIGVLCHVFSTWIIFLLLIESDSKYIETRGLSPLSDLSPLSGMADSPLAALLLTLAYAVSGAFVWAALSGMETSLFVFAVLLTFYAYQRDRQLQTLWAAAFAALVRPEGAILAVTVGAVYVWRKRTQPRKLLWLLIPIAAILIQPVVNFLLTDSFSASGVLAKSHLYNATIPFSERLKMILDFKERLWEELFIGQSPVDGWYMIPLVTIPAGLAMLLSLRTSWRTRSISPGLMAVIWMILLSAAVATLETAFWHFKRYQLPIMALMFPLAGWLILRYQAALPEYRRGMQLLAGSILLGALWTCVNFARMYAANVMVVNDQQLAMARWIDENLPDDARIGVHDVGLMRYIGDRATYDVVGLTTPGAASAWRQGAGTLYEVMAAHPDRPDYFTIYPDVQSIPFLVEAGVLGEELARFEMQLPHNTVASATGTQVVTRADWSGVEAASHPHQTDVLEYTRTAVFRAGLNIGNITHEQDSGYLWHNIDTPPGFASEVRRLPYVTCASEPCTVVDGARAITGGERFSLPLQESAMGGRMIVLRVHAASPATLTAGCDDHKQIRVVPDLPGQWVEIIFTEAGYDQFCLESSGAYYPAYYWIYEQGYIPVVSDADPIATFTDPFVTDFTFDLITFKTEMRDSGLNLYLIFQSYGNLPHDGKIFVHVYDDVNMPPLAQLDTYTGNGAVPPANWLPGVREDTFTLPLDAVPPGDYTLAIGFYDPVSGKRYGVQSPKLDSDGERLFLGMIQVE